MDINIEIIPEYKIAYIRKVGPYGLENVQVMEQLKSWAKENSLFNERSIILGITQDNPEITEPVDSRYDACLVVSDEFYFESTNINIGKTIGGKYCVFKINHTVDAIQKAWLEIFSELSKRNYKIDDKRKIIERYTMQMISNHYCEICVPIL
ncbi:AraC family transcriptional regulator [Clostridium beijerinckii]|uniref:DNA gyrase inhibitor GyrI n=1 Tax=Clostridium beijerinckii TaxID=1520 RepID=A0A9Q5CTS1_CLOBE|nr:GyrI-like domain-containing protein [Clostridium beijerinckii]AQS05441.1 DNA gyrase inhibitor [Clostridium beijerinckii]MBA2885495.1 DNA gyrase inhibitor GyrI [Clostridium beijerinckii]MBA2900229.1 DNA gyrase inhibitor GyrI [Clostridium beijerinckii]MBA2910054.1 DNA gyrase inhibitor GyrI [Clostridium beijerinckii]MBA9014983.1 DNA gyrase inhibitor GyrI [Clostridium beijerinckii]